MTIGVGYNQPLLSSQMLKKFSSNGKILASIGVDNNISQQVVEKFSEYYSDVKKYDRAATKNDTPGKVIYFTGKSNPPENEKQQAVNYAFIPVAKNKSFVYSTSQSAAGSANEDEIAKLLTEIDDLVQKCYSGNTAAFKKLIDLSKGKLTNINGMINGTSSFEDVFAKAKNAVYSLIDEAPNYPNMFYMMTQSGLLDEKEFGQDAKLPEKLINEAASSSKAMQQLKSLLNDGTIRLEDYGKKAIEMDPESAVATLVELSQGNRSKDQGLTIVNLLADVATNQPGSQAGSMAAKGLKKIIKTEGQNGILTAAFEGLTKASMAGNNDALQSLEDLVKDPTISKNKAMMAVKCLTKVATSGSAGGGKATKILVGLARDKSLAPQIREKVVDGLTEIAATGNGNASMAADALLDLAKTPQDPIGKKALANVMTLKNTDIMDKGKLNDVLQNAARSNKTDAPIKKEVTNMLADSGNQNPFDKKIDNNFINNNAFNNNNTSNAEYNPFFDNNSFNAISPDKENLNKGNIFTSFVSSITDPKKKALSGT